MTKTIVIDDTTLRDGEQSAGVAFTESEKIEIATHLSTVGVPELEIGIPAMGAEEQAVMRAISDLKLNSKLLAWCRMTEGDIAAARNTGVHIVDLSIPVSDQQIQHKLGYSRTKILQHIDIMVKKARDAGFDVCVGCEDASRADQEFLFRVLEKANLAGARRIRFADTLGVLDPFKTHHYISCLRERSDIEIEMHAHDDFGMATANTLAAVMAGATHINTTVNGLGERAGNAPLEELVLSLKHLYGMDTGINIAALPALSKRVENASGRFISWQKSIVGEGVFMHESGIHVDGLMKDTRNYQSLNPKDLGREHQLVLGKHSGTGYLKKIYADMGYHLEREQLDLLLQQVRQYAALYKSSPDSNQLIAFLGNLETLKTENGLRHLQ